MKCPVCTNVDLLMSERQGIEIDYCPNCRGIWLDRGELDKLIEKSNQQQGQATQQQYFSKEHKHHDDHYKHKKKGGWLSDLFD